MCSPTNIVEESARARERDTNDDQYKKENEIKPLLYYQNNITTSNNNTNGGGNGGHVYNDDEDNEITWWSWIPWIHDQDHNIHFYLFLCVCVSLASYSYGLITSLFTASAPILLLYLHCGQTLTWDTHQDSQCKTFPRVYVIGSNLMCSFLSEVPTTVYRLAFSGPCTRVYLYLFCKSFFMCTAVHV